MDTLTCKILNNESRAEYEKHCLENDASFLQSWDWGDWQKENGQDPIRLAVFENEQIICTAQFLIHKTPAGRYLYCPYGPVVNAKFQISNAKFIQTIIEALKSSFPDCLFIRIEPTFEFNSQLACPPKPRRRRATRNSQPTSHIQPGSTIISDLTKTEAELLAGMHSKTRYGIRVAERYDIEVRKIQPSEYAAAAKLFVDTLVRRNLTVQNAGYFEKMMSRQDSGGLHTSTFGAFKDGLLLATAYCVDYGNTRVYLYGGSCSTHKEKMPSYLLHWTIIKDAKSNGLVKYDWWGAENSKGEKPGFVIFKERFGGKTITYGQPFDVVLHPMKYRAYKILRTVNRIIRKLK